MFSEPSGGRGGSSDLMTTESCLDVPFSNHEIPTQNLGVAFSSSEAASEGNAAVRFLLVLAV